VKEMLGTGRLDASAKAKLEQSLRARLAELQGSLRDGVNAQREARPSRPAEVGVQAAETLEDDIRVALLNQRSQQVLQIQGALQRLAQGEYGLCRSCDEFIGVARLRALPFAQRCSSCQAATERRDARIQTAA
jgi:DnaK suppressor protein